MKPIRFMVRGDPRPKLRHRVAATKTRSGKCLCRTYKNETTEVDEQAFAMQSAVWRPEEPLEGPLCVSLVFVFTPSQKRRARALKGQQAHTIAPDVDNLVKLALDAMNEVFWHDDVQIIELRARKLYGAEARTEVEITRAVVEVAP